MQRSFFSELTPIRRELRRLAAEDRLEGDERWLMQSEKPAEELYDLKTDPFELHNLAGEANQKEQLESMRNTLYEWMLETRDTSLIPESDLVSRTDGIPPWDFFKKPGAFDFEKAVSVAGQIGMEDKAADEILDHISDEDAAIRFLGMTALAAIGSGAADELDLVWPFLDDPVPAVRFAAAEVVCNAGDCGKAVEILAEGLSHQSIYVRLHAAQILFILGEKAEPVVPEMKRAIVEAEKLQDHGWYMREALTDLVDQLEGQ
jgi:uncharacterized sulfatase